MPLDRLDLTIIAELTRNARQSLVDLAEHVGLSTTAVDLRLKLTRDLHPKLTRLGRCQYRSGRVGFACSSLLAGLG